MHISPWFILFYVTEYCSFTFYYIYVILLSLAHLFFLLIYSWPLLDLVKYMNILMKLNSTTIITIIIIVTHPHQKCSLFIDEDNDRPQTVWILRRFSVNFTYRMHKQNGAITAKGWKWITFSLGPTLTWQKKPYGWMKTTKSLEWLGNGLREQRKEA